jgi:hypothetical protein
MQVGATHAAGSNLQEHLARAGYRKWATLPRERFAWPVQSHARRSFGIHAGTLGEKHPSGTLGFCG